jgi:Flp pilus assembly protein TadB
VIAVLTVGAVTGFGLWIIYRAVTTRQSLADIDARLSRPGIPASAPPATSGRADLERHVVDRTIGLLERVGLDPARRQHDLVVTRTTVEQHVTAKLAWAMAGFALVPILAALATAVGLRLAVGPLVVLAVAAAAGGFLVPELGLSERAKSARAGFRHAYGAYLDLVDVMTAAGMGPEAALHGAADAGDGWAFEQLRAALDAARHSRSLSVWAALGDLGRRLGVVELAQLAASASLVDSEGARIRDSLAAQAETLRAAQLAEVEAHAETVTERMSVPLVVLLTGFLIFIAYPGVVTIAGVGGP